MTKQEIDLLIEILPSYTAHLESNPKSLIAKIFGVFTVTVESMQPVYVMLMENTIKLKSLDSL